MTIQKKLALVAFAAAMAAGSGTALAQGKALASCSDAAADKCSNAVVAAKADKLNPPKISATVSTTSQVVLKAAAAPKAGEIVEGSKAK